MFIVFQRIFQGIVCLCVTFKSAICFPGGSALMMFSFEKHGLKRNVLCQASFLNFVMRKVLSIYWKT
jgi:hypothetical protein